MSEQFSILIDSRTRFETSEPGGVWLSMPTTKEQLHEAMQRVGITADNPQDFLINGFMNTEQQPFDVPLPVIQSAGLDELNYLGNLLSMQRDEDRNKFTAAVTLGERAGNIKDLINLAQNLDCYWLYPTVQNEEDYGYYLIDELDELELSEEAKKYFMYEDYGRDAAINDGGRFTEQGYIYNNKNTFTEWYNGKESDIPREYKVMSFPQPERPDPSKVEMDAAAPEQPKQEAPAQEKAAFTPETIYRVRRNPYSDSKDNTYLLQAYVTQENGRAKMSAVLFTGTPQKCRELMGQLKSGELTEGQVKELYAKAQETAKTAEQDKDTYSIYQLKHGDETRDLRFEPYDRLQVTGNVVDKANYELIYSAELTPGTSLEDIYTRFNIDHPKDFKGHSLSVSDVVVLHQDGQDTAHYVDSFGYKSVPEFLQEQKQLTPDELETGETIKTPRGTFYVTDMSREQMEAAGYGFHHQSDDGKYLVMGNGTRAFAIAAEQAQRENPLKAAEQTTEQNENMIDEIINNTPSVDELEAKVKAGETISLVDLANAVKADKERGKGKQEKKPSIRAQLKADKEKAQKKAAVKTKNHDLEV